MSTKNAAAGPSSAPSSNSVNTETTSTRSGSLSERIRGISPALTGRAATNGDGKGTKINLGGLLSVPEYASIASEHRPDSPSSSRQSARRTRKVRKPSSVAPPTDAPIDPLQVAAMQSARLKLFTRDEEAIRKARSTMMQYFSTSTPNLFSLDSPGPRFGAESPLNDLTPTRSAFSRQNSNGNNEKVSSNQMVSEEERTPKLEDPGPSTQRETILRPLRNAPDGGPLPPTTAADCVIAVVGHEGVGKSTVISRALKAWGVSNPVVSEIFEGLTMSSCFSRIRPGGKHTVGMKAQFLEMSLAALDLFYRSEEIWPSGLPAITGAIVCYDATRGSSLHGVSELLQRLSSDGIITVMLACKSDPGVPIEVEAVHGNSIGEPFNVGLIEVTTGTPDGRDKMRNGVRWLLRKLELNKQELERKAALGLVISLSNTSSRHSDQGEHSAPPQGEVASNADRNEPNQGAITAVSSTQDPASTPRSSSSSLKTKRMVQGSSVDDLRSLEPSTIEVPRLWSDRKSIHGEALEMLASNERSEDADSKSESILYMSLPDLLDSLFNAILTANDEAFIHAFFMTYRRFCRQQDLMAEFLERFRWAGGQAVSDESRNWAVMRMTGALINWTYYYPGDLHEIATQELFRDTLALVLQHSFIAHVAEDLVSIERSLPEAIDIDASWSFASASGLSETAPATSSPPVPLTQISVNDEGFDDEASGMGTSEPNTPVLGTYTPSVLSLSSASSIHRAVTGSDARASGHTVKKELATGDIGPSQWGYALAYVLNSNPRSIAVELTKLQLGLFMAMRPRDIFRHAFGKERDTPVGRSIEFFNHLSRWVTTMTLVSPKAKYRARVYEHFMLVAHHLRRLNDYESLYAVISGMRETSVQRLSQTQQLVQPAPGIEKEFQHHLNLLDPGGGYARYRRALQADLADEHAAIPLLTAILGLVNRLQTVRPEDRRSDGCVHWDKFARFAEILGVISECQTKTPMVSGSPSSTFRLILEDTPVMMEEDALFERSKLLEPQKGGGGGGAGGSVMRRLASLGLAETPRD